MTKLRISALLVAVMMLMMIAASATVLRPGDKGTAVREVQAALNAQGYASLRVDGTYGTKTAEAVSRFQAANGLKVDGKAGPMTLERLLGKTDLDNHTESADKIKTGSKGAAVRQIQLRLAALKYPVGAVDGTYGKKTIAAVRLFQKLNGLKADGVVGKNTKAKLNSASAVAYYVPHTYPKLRKGDSGSAVSRVQYKLKELGYYAGNVTGFYNDATVAAVTAFQSAQGLRVDGIAGQKTQERLFGK